MKELQCPKGNAPNNGGTSSLLLQAANSIVANHMRDYGYEYTLSTFMPEAGINLDKVCMYVCVYLCIYLCMYVCMYLSIYVSMYVSMYVCMYSILYLYKYFLSCSLLLILFIFFTYQLVIHYHK